MTQDFIHSILLIKANIIYPSIKYRYIFKDKEAKQKNVLKKYEYLFFTIDFSCDFFTYILGVLTLIVHKQKTYKCK